MKKIIKILIITFILVGSVSGSAVAQQESDTIKIDCGTEETEFDFKPAISVYNNNTDKVPDIMKTALSANTTDFTIKNTSVNNYTVQTNSELQITNFDTKKPKNPDVIVYTEEAVLCEIVKSEDPINSFQESYDEGEIEVEGQGFVNSARVFLVDIANDLVGSVI